MNAGSTPPEDESGRAGIRLTAIEAILPTLASKEDLANLRTEFGEGLAALRTDLLFEIGNLRKEQHKASQTLLKWVVSTMLTLVLASLGTMLAIMNMALMLARSMPAHSTMRAPPVAARHSVTLSVATPAQILYAQPCALAPIRRLE